MITDTKHDVPQPAKQDLSEEVFEKYDLFNTEETATLYSKHQPHLDQTVVDTVLAVVPNRDLLVDVGCGSGSSTRPFAPHFSRVVGVDYSPAQISLGKQLSAKIDNVHFHQGSIYNLPVTDNSVDCIVGVMIAQFIDIPSFFAEVKRVLRPGGVILFHGKGSPTVVEVEGTGENSSVEEINKRIVYIKTKLFKGLFHDRTHFNPMKYSNIPALHPERTVLTSSADKSRDSESGGESDQSVKKDLAVTNQSCGERLSDQCVRKEWNVTRWYTLPQLADYMLTWSAAGKYCKLHGTTSEQLKEKLVEMLRCGDKGISRVRCSAERFLWYSRN